MRGVRKVYGSGDTQVTALDGIDLKLETGGLAALLGPSGCGKTTLLLIAGLLEPPTSGEVFVAGQAINPDDTAGSRLRSFRRRHIGFVFQKANLIPFLSARENVQIAMEVDGKDSEDAARRSRELLEYLDVIHRENNLPRQLSGGEQQRVAVARALANRPQLVLADEPTAALDSRRGRQVFELFGRIAREQGTSVLCVTHDQRSLDVFDRLLHMQDGRLVKG
ncbi:ABC transporter [Pseudoxanthomonas kalamensis DSM 18571]|nr:ABC transporter [Pseudoxanthomonas kalamensis DSM 18571]